MNEAATCRAAEPRAPRGVRILLAEDNPINQRIALLLLERLGHAADAVGTGAAAVAALAEADYDLVLMDVMMPEMDGLAATRLIRAGEGPGRRVAVVGLTAGDRPEDIAACLAAGMDAAASKPVTRATLAAAIAEGLSLAAEHRARPEPPAQLRDLLEALGEEAVAEIVEAFAEDTQAHLAAMCEALAQGDRASLHRQAHSIAGAGRNVGATALGTLAATVEHGVGKMADAEIAATIAAMQAELDAVLPTLRP